MIGLSVPAVALAYLALQISVSFWNERAWRIAAMVPVYALCVSLVLTALLIAGGMTLHLTPFNAMVPGAAAYLAGLWSLRLVWAGRAAA